MKFSLRENFIRLAATTLLVGSAAATARAEEPAAAPAAAGASDAGAAHGAWANVTFAERSPLSASAELEKRFQFKDDAPAYDLASESFQLYTPAGVRPGNLCGLLVWIDAGNDGRLPPEWAPVLDRHRLLAVGANNSGNPRAVLHRWGLALDAVHNLKKTAAIDDTRVYISGFSGGSRCAGMLAAQFPDVFRGAFLLCGCNHWRAVESTSHPGKQFAPRFPPPPKDRLNLLKTRSRLVLVAGEKDFNREQTKAVYDDLTTHEGFTRVLFMDVPGMGHGAPGAEWFEKGVAYLEGGGGKPAE